MSKLLSSRGLSRRVFLKWTGLAAGSAALAACQPQSTPAPTSAPTQAAVATTAPTQARYTARLAVEQASVPDFAEMPQVWAVRTNKFAENGVDLELLETGGGAAVAVEPLQMLVSEQIDFTDVLFPAGFEVVLDGAPLVGLGIFASGGRYDYWMVTKNDITEWSDMVGRKYVISSPGGPPDGIGRYAFSRYGVDPSQVEFVPLGGSSARTQALLAGEVDAALVHPPDALQLVADNPGIHIFSKMEEAPLLFGIDATFRRNVEENRPMVVAYVRTVIEAVRAFIDDEQLAISAYQELVPEADADILAEARQDYIDRGVWHPNGDVTQELYDATMNAYVEIGGLPSAVPYADFMDPSIVAEALDQIGRR